MVRELQVLDDRPTHTPEQIDQVRWEQAYFGVPVPDWLRELNIESSGLAWMYEKLERGRSATRAAAEWDAYRLSLGDLAADPRSPRERLEGYYANSNRA